jgi:hypothetical protein
MRTKKFSAAAVRRKKMAKSNSGSDLAQNFVETHEYFIGRQHPIFIVNGDKDKNKIFEQQIFIEYSRVSKRPIHIFHNVDDCYNFVMEQLYADKYAKCFVIVSDQLANEIIPEIVNCEQIEEIMIIDNNLLTQQEKELMKIHSKVRE